MTFTVTMLETSAALCFVVAIILTTVSVWFRFRYFARGIVNAPAVGSILHAGWIFDTLIRDRLEKVSAESIRLGELAGAIWVAIGVIALSLAWHWHDEHGDADEHGEPSTCRAFCRAEALTESGAIAELKKSGRCVAVRR